MNTIEKRKKLIKLASSVLDDITYRDELTYLMSNLNINREQAIQGYLDYDMDLFAYGNEVYQWPSIQLTLHIHNYLRGSWHPIRHQTILEFVKIAQPQKIIDIGFGVPGHYIRDYVFKNENTFVDLCDINQNAFKFAEILLRYWNNCAFEQRVAFIKTDMDSLEFVGNADLYLFQDSIEHTPFPEKYLDIYVEKSSSNAKFLFSMPIAPLIPMHYIAWERIDDAENWLAKRGLTTIKKKIIRVNPEIDLFAENLDFANLVVLCTKR